MHKTLLAALLAVATGCATMPTTGTQATGEPLSVESGMQTHTWVSQDKVGEVRTTDSDGNTIAKSDVYENREHVSHEFVWTPTQGSLKLDDEDFFRIAGDAETANQIHQSRESGVFWNHTGLAVLAAGLAVMVGGYALKGSSDTDGAGNALVVTSSLLVPIGGIMTYFGLAKANAQHPVDDYDHALALANAYNRRLVAAQAPSPAYAPNVPEDAPVIPAPPPTPKRHHRRATSVTTASNSL